jgi:hypothetical protein
MVHFEETNNIGDVIETYYPSKLLGFITTNGTREAVVQCSVNLLCWDDIQQNFIVDIELGLNFDVSFVFVPIESIVHPLCVIPDDSDQTNRYFVVLPKQIGVVTLEIIS